MNTKHSHSTQVNPVHMVKVSTESYLNELDPNDPLTVHTKCEHYTLAQIKSYRQK